MQGIHKLVEYFLKGRKYNLRNMKCTSPIQIHINASVSKIFGQMALSV